MDWNSSLVAGALYQPERAILDVALHSGAAYRYFDVPAQTYQELVRAESKGGYFNAHVRNCFACAKIRPPRRIRDSGRVPTAEG